MSRSPLFLFLLSILLCGCSKNTPVATNGVLDLTHFDFYEEGAVRLNGEWEFYPNRLLAPGGFNSPEISSSKKYIKVPSMWNKTYIEGEKLPGYGYGTYRLIINHNIDNDEIVAIKMGEACTSYKIWVDGKEIFSVGKVGRDASSSRAEFKTHVTPFTIDTCSTEIVLQVSNFDYKDGGLKAPVEFGLDRYLIHSRERGLIFYYFLFGCIFIMGLYHLTLTFLSKHQQTTLLFALFCFLVSPRVLVINEYYITYLIPGIPWDVHHRIIVMGYYLASIIFITLTYRLFTREFSKTILRIFQITGVILSLIVLATLPSFYSHTEIIFQVMICLGLIYIFIINIKAIRNKRNGALLFLGGFITMFIASVNDILNAHYLSPYQNLLPLGIFIFIILQSYILAKHFSNAVTISEELAVTNRRLQESNEAKDKFFSIIAHDLRGPIGNTANLLKYTDIENVTPELLTLLQSTTQNNFELVEDLLSWARTQKGHIDIEPKNFNISQVLKKVVFTMQNSARQKDIQLIISGNQDELFVYADIPSVNTVIRNLVANAIKFTDEGGSVILSATESDNEIKITVSDTGIGMSPDIQTRLFKPENKSSSPGTMGEKGTGLGLLLCKEFVELNKGSIGLESEINKGSAFWFSLPRGSKLDEESILELIRAKQPMALIVEDDYLSLQNTIAEISRAGIKYDVAKDGRAAVAKGCKKEYDFILMDIDLPKKNGVEVTMAIRKKYPEALIIALSSYNKKEITEQYNTSCFNGYLSKPLNVFDLLYVLERTLVVEHL